MSTQPSQSQPRGGDLNPKPRDIRRWLILAVGFCSISLTLGFGYFALPIFYKDLLEEFGWNRSTLMIGPGGSLLFYTLLSPLIGRQVDQWGSRRILLLGVFLFSGGFHLLAYVHSITQFVLANCLVGAGMACTSYVPVQVLVAKWFQDRRGLAVGLITVGGSAGGAAAPLLAESLIGRFGWRMGFEAVAVFAAALLIPALLLIVRDAPASSNQAVANPAFAPRKLVLPREFLWVLGVCFSTLMFSVTIILQHLVIYMVDTGVSAHVAAGLLTLLLVAGAVGRLVAGYVGDRMSKMRLVLASIGILSLAPVALLFSSMPILFAPFAIVFGLGYGAVVASMPLLIVFSYPSERVGLPLGVFYAFGAFGGSVGPILAGYMFDTTGRYLEVFGVLWAVILVTLGTLLVFFRKSVWRQRLAAL